MALPRGFTVTGPGALPRRRGVGPAGAAAVALHLVLLGAMSWLAERSLSSSRTGEAAPPLAVRVVASAPASPEARADAPVAESKAEAAAAADVVAAQPRIGAARGAAALGVPIAPATPLTAGPSTAGRSTATATAARPKVALSNGGEDRPSHATHTRSAAVVQASGSRGPAPPVAPAVVPVEAPLARDDGEPEAPRLDESSYLPRRLLTQAPQALAPVLLAFPPGTADGGRHVGVLALFIAEDGSVRRVRAEGAGLPGPLEEAARAAFSATRFRPGERDGRPVRALMRVEVVYDSRPLQRGAQPPDAAADRDAAP